VKAAGGRTVIVSTKIESAVRLVVEAVGFVVDEIAGGLFAEAKGHYLRRIAASCARTCGPFPPGSPDTSQGRPGRPACGRIPHPTASDTGG